MTRVNRRRYMSHFLPDIDGHDGGYLTLTALEDTTFTLTIGSGVGSDCGEIYYSIDDGETWVYTQNENFQGVTVTTPLITKGNWVLWKGVNKRMSKAATITGSSRFSSDGLFSVGGSLQSLIWGDEYETKLSTKDWLSFAWLFHNSKVRNARNLKFTATSMSPATYSGMFSECYYLKTPPKEIKYGGQSAYINLFSGCIHLKYGPDILIETLPTECLKGMFNGCKQLKCVKILSADVSASNCLQDWMKGVNPTGTFIKMIDMTFPSGQSGIPTGWSTSDCIMSVNTNPAVLNICYAQGWAANDNYMTKSEAEAVTSFGNVFKSFTGESLMELRYFTSVASVGLSSFTNCNNLKYVWFSVSSVNGYNGGANTCIYTGCSSLIAARYDNLTRIGATTYNSPIQYAVITAESVPIAATRFFESKFYVLDELVDLYKETEYWSNKTIKPISALLTDYPDCPWLDDLREKGLIPTT